MPRRPQQREVGSEQQLVTAIRSLKEQRGLSYEQLAQRMTDAGCKMHASGVQKTVEQGRRVTVDELVGYARAFDTTPESLLQYGGQREPRTQESWRDLIHATDLRAILGSVGEMYTTTMLGLSTEVSRNTELRQQIEIRRDRALRAAEREARAQAELESEDVSTPDLLRTFMKRWGYLDGAILVACRDALAGSTKRRNGPTKPADDVLVTATRGLDPTSTTYADDVLSRIRNSQEGGTQ